MKLLGLDISTTCVGWSILDYTNNKYSLIDIGYFEPLKLISNTKKLKELTNCEFLDMLNNSRNIIKNIILKCNPDVIAIEDYIRFMAGGSGASTIIPLATLNRIISLTAYETMNFNKEKIKICNVVAIRNCIKRIENLPTLPKKEELHPLLEKIMSIKLPVIYMQSKKKQKISAFTYDQSDSVAVAFYAAENIGK